MLTLKTPTDLAALKASGQAITIDARAHLQQVAPFFSYDYLEAPGTMVSLKSCLWAVAGVFDLVLGCVTPLNTVMFWKAQNLTITWDDSSKKWGKDFQPILERLGLWDCSFISSLPGEKLLVNPGEDRFKDRDLNMLLATIKSMELTAKHELYPEVLGGFIEARRAYLRKCARRIKKDIPYTRVMLAHASMGVKTMQDLNVFYSQRFAWVNTDDDLAAIAETVDNAPWVQDLYSCWFISKELFTLKKLGLTLLKEPAAALPDSAIRLIAFALMGGLRAKKAAIAVPVVEPDREANREALLDTYNASLEALHAPAAAVYVAEVSATALDDFGLPDEAASLEDFDFEVSDEVPQEFDF